MSNNEYLDFDDYFNDETKVSKEDKAIIELETLLIGKMIEIREKKGLTQRELAELTGMKQPAIARLKNYKQFLI